MRRILFLGSLLPEDVSNDNPYSSVAANSFQYNLLAGLTRYGIEQIEALTLYPVAAFPRSRHRRCLPSRYRLFDCSRLSVPGFSNIGPLKPFSQMFSVLKQIFNMWFRKSFDPDIVVTYNAPQRIAIPAILAGKLFRIPVVCIAADVQPLEPLRFEINNIITRLRAHWIRRFDGIIMLSGKVTDDFCQGLPIIRMEGGVDAGEFERLSASVADRTCNEDDSYNILYAGTLVESAASFYL